MEWHIMNAGGITSLCSNIGYVDQGMFYPSDECQEVLQELIEQFEEKDVLLTLKQMYCLDVVNKDLVPMIKYLKDDPEIFSEAVRLMSLLTQPVECLQHQQGKGQALENLIKSQAEARTLCIDAIFLRALFSEINVIILDAGEYRLEEENVCVVNNCLLLLRNILYVPTSEENDTCAMEKQAEQLKIVFGAGFERLLMTLLQHEQKEAWCLVIIQIISLLYKTAINDLLQTEQSDISDAASDTSDPMGDFKSNMSFTSKSSMNSLQEGFFVCGLGNGDSVSSVDKFEYSNNSSPKLEEEDIPDLSCVFRETSEVSPGINDTDVQRKTPGRNSPHTMSCDPFEITENIQNDRMTLDSETKDKIPNANLSCELADSKETHPNNMSCNLADNNENIPNDNMSFASSDSIDNGANDNMSWVSVENKESTSEMNNEVRQMMHNFTCTFIKNGFCSLMSDVMNVLISKKEEMEDLYLLWGISFFSKFSRHENMLKKNIREILKPEVFGFLCYECVLHCEDVLRNGKTENLHGHMKKLHLSVTALNELMKVLVDYQQDTEVTEENAKLLEKLQRELASMSDLRQLFVFLIRKFEFHHYSYSTQFMKELVSANHQYLLLIETWSQKGYCNEGFEMLEHVKQFATVDVMHRYGYLLQDFSTNTRYINNCIMTMMHHIAGDCERSDVLMQTDIINMFLQLLNDEDIEQVINDLIEYVLSKFVVYAENNPYSVAAQMFGSENGLSSPKNSCDDDSEEWTMENDDMMMMLLMEMTGEADLVSKIENSFIEIGQQKKRSEIVTHMLNSDWLQDCDRASVLEEAKLCNSASKNKSEVTGKKRKHEVLELLTGAEEQKIQEIGVIPFCVKKLQEEGHKSYLEWLQNIFCEATFVKLSGEVVEKYNSIEEPISKYHLLQRKSIPIVFYSVEQEQAMQDEYFCLLIEHLGLHLPDNVNRVFPRIPFIWSSKQIFEKALELGPLDGVNLKFSRQDMCNVKDSLEDFSSEFGKFDDYKSSKAAKHAELMDRVAPSKLLSESLWTSFVQTYNLQISPSSSQQSLHQ